MVAITLVGGFVIRATDHHPFWDATTHTFTYADALHAGDKLRKPNGHRVAIARIRDYRADLTAYNLTISGIHTYYVLAGQTAVLVHNSCVSGSDAPEPGAAPDSGSAPEPTKTVYRYHNADDPATLQPKLAQSPPEVQAQVQEQLKDPNWVATRARQHMVAGNTVDSPFVSVTTDY